MAGERPLLTLCRGEEKRESCAVLVSGSARAELQAGSPEHCRTFVIAGPAEAQPRVCLPALRERGSLAPALTLPRPQLSRAAMPLLNKPCGSRPDTGAGEPEQAGQGAARLWLGCGPVEGDISDGLWPEAGGSWHGGGSQPGAGSLYRNGVLTHPPLNPPGQGRRGVLRSGGYLR